jgi:Uncharacterized protein conserved in bacteria
VDPRRERRLKLVKTLEETIEKAGYECVDVEMTHEEGRSILRVIIDSTAGIGVGDCEKVSRALSGIQEEIDPFFRGKHFIEVSSPGLERPLRKLEDFRRFQGSKARVQLKESLNGQRNFKGQIHSVDGEKIVFLTEDEVSIVFPFGSVRKANLVYEGEI